MKSANITARVEPNVKARATTILKKIGLSSSEAINLFLNQVILHKGMPFDVRIPNEETLKAFRDSEAGRNMERFDTVDELFEDLES